MAEKMTFYTLTAAGWQQMILEEIRQLEWQRNCVREDIRDQLAIEIDNRDSYYEQYLEDLETEEQELTNKLWEQEKRHHRLMGFYSDGIPF